MRFAIVLISVCSLAACRPGRELALSASEGEPRIGFLTLRMDQQSAAVPLISLLDYLQSPGVFKQLPATNDPTRLTVTLYRDGRLLDSQQVPHPLLRQIEYATESGSYATLQNHPKSADFPVRFRSAAPPDELHITEYRAGLPPRPLNTIPLNRP